MKQLLSAYSGIYQRTTRNNNKDDTVCDHDYYSNASLIVTGNDITNLFRMKMVSIFTHTFLIAKTDSH